MNFYELGKAAADSDYVSRYIHESGLDSNPPAIESLNKLTSGNTSIGGGELGGAYVPPLFARLLYNSNGTPEENAQEAKIRSGGLFLQNEKYKGNPAVIAHELGHAVHPNLATAAGPGRLLSLPAGITGGAILGTRRKSRLAGAVGGGAISLLASAPWLLSEHLANQHSNNLLAKDPNVSPQLRQQGRNMMSGNMIGQGSAAALLALASAGGGALLTRKVKNDKKNNLSNSKEAVYFLGKAAAKTAINESHITDKTGKRKVRPQEPGRPPENMMDGKERRDVFDFPGTKKVKHKQAV